MAEETPLKAKILLFLAIVYFLSPIDLIPDFIPVIGYLDDLIIVPTLIWLAFREIEKSAAEKRAAALRSSAVGLSQPEQCEVVE
ncbi:MAG TPA: YkvA family protein [Candidatus Rifleibacterium sp.]|nr:YkvA family protein [Candidatus Rifleibacterium sp.]HPW58827.1 YkvA family protein [Candidatus Rifleibacterium sp.]